MKRFWLVPMLVLSQGVHAQGEPAQCSVPGEPVQWIADYCMASLGTDDEIVASECINERIQDGSGWSACQLKERYKREWCRLMVANRSFAGTVEACVLDPKTGGSTVRDVEH